LESADMPMPKFDKAVCTRLALAAMLCALLSACATDDESMSRLAVAPGNYRLYSCPQLAYQIKLISEQAEKLRALMDKAGTTSSGRLVSDASYRPDYLVAIGQIREMRKEEAVKNCSAAPGAKPAATPATRKSDTFIR
jgi:hypothetical protein